MKKGIIILTIFTVLFGAMFRFADTVKASVDYTVEDYLIENNLPIDSYMKGDNLSYNDYFLFQNDEYIYCIMYDKQCTLVTWGDNNKYFALKSASGYVSYWRIMRIPHNGTEWSCYADGNTDGSVEYTIPRSPYGSTLFTLGLFSTRDLYDYDGTLFFQVTPPLTLNPIAEKVEMSKVMIQVVGLIPLVIGLVVLAIALRKALAVLQMALHRA